jgi:hypothetical protein
MKNHTRDSSSNHRQEPWTRQHSTQKQIASYLFPHPSLKVWTKALSLSLQEPLGGAWVSIGTGSQVAWSRERVMMREWLLLKIFWRHKNNKKNDAGKAHFMRPSSRSYTQSLTGGVLLLEPACQSHRARKARHRNGYRHNHMEKTRRH